MPSPAVHSSEPSLAHHPTYPTILVGAMAVSTIHMFGTAVLATDIIDELGISRTEVGFVGAANTAVGALMAPFLGSWTDRIGPRRAIAALSIAGAAGLGLLATAVGLWSLLVSSVVSGLSQGWANPATNASIAAHLRPGERGTVAGIKQSGVQLSTFLCGATLPIAASTIGWRAAIWAYAALSLGVAALAHIRHPSDEPASGPSVASPTMTTAPARRLPAVVWRIALYALLLGLAGGSVFRFLPLFAEEEVGMSSEMAGAILAANGLLAIGARIWWGRVTDGGFPSLRALQLMAAGSAVSSGLLLVAPDVPAMLWIFAVLAAFTASAWNVVAMLAVIGGVDVSLQGRATGVVIFGFLGGLSIGGPLTGWSVDTTGSYDGAWIATIVLGILALAVVSGQRQR